MDTSQSSQYDPIATRYADYASLPLAKLEQELVAKAIGNCTGLTLLDLGGGDGQYARKAIDLGAELVDVLDVSPGMLEAGIELEAKAGREGKIRWFEADATKALHHLPLMPEGYDIVMCNWVFDHAANHEELESMYRNMSTQLKPGGKLVNVRVTGNLDADYAVSGKYGVRISDLTPTPTGMLYQVNCHTDPPFHFEGSALNVHTRVSNEINHRNGLGDLEILRPEDTDVVRADEDFWEAFVKRPYMGVMTARKP